MGKRKILKGIRNLFSTEVDLGKHFTASTVAKILKNPDKYAKQLVDVANKYQVSAKDLTTGIKRGGRPPKGADLTDVFKAKNIKDPKTFLKKRKEVVGKMTKSRQKDIKRKEKFVQHFSKVIGNFGKGGAIKKGIKKAAELKKKMVEAREETLRKSPKGSRIRKLKKGYEEMKARKKFGKGGRVIRKLAIQGEKGKEYASRSASEIKKGLEGWAKQKYGIGYKKLREKKREIAEKIANIKAGEGWSRKTPKDVKKEMLPDAPYYKKGGTVSGDLAEKAGEAVGNVKRLKKRFKKGYKRGSLTQKEKDDFKKTPQFRDLLSIERDLWTRGGADITDRLQISRKELQKRRDAKAARNKTQGMAKGGEVKGDSEYQDTQLSMDYAKSILNIARKRKPSGVINQDDINAAKEEFNRSKELQRSRQTDPIPMPKTSKRSLVKPMEGPIKDLIEGRMMDPKYIQPGGSGEGVEQSPYRKRRLGPGMKEGGSVSNEPKHRGWGKAIKGTKFKGTF